MYQPHLTFWPSAAYRSTGRMSMRSSAGQMSAPGNLGLAVTESEHPVNATLRCSRVTPTRSGRPAGWSIVFLPPDLPLMRVVHLRFAAHPVGYVFADHDAGEVDVRPRDGWHDRGVGDAQVGDAADPAVLVDHG